MSEETTDELGRTKLMLAVKNQSKEVIKELLRFGSDAFLTDRNGRTVLFYAAERGEEEIVWLLLSSLAGTGIANQRGALLGKKDNEGNRAEDWAQINGKEDIYKILTIERQRIDFFE